MDLFSSASLNSFSDFFYSTFNTILFIILQNQLAQSHPLLMCALLTHILCFVLVLVCILS